MRTYFTKIALIGCVGASLVGCAANSSPSAATPTSVQGAIAIGCPIVTAIEQSTIALNRIQAAALGSLALVCPPNPPPNSATVVISDIVSAYQILRPLVK